MRRVWLTVGIVVVLAGGGVLYQTSTSTSNTAHSQTPPAGGPGGLPPVPVVAATAKRQPTPVRLQAVGTVQTIASVAIKSRLDGLIDKVLVKDGQYVKAGDVLFQLDPRLAQAQINQTMAQVARDRAQLVNAQRDVKRYQPLAEKEFVSRQQMDTASTTSQAGEAAVKADEALTENARVLLSYLTITAPIEGRLGYINTKAGNSIKANDVALVTINQIKPIYVNFPISQTDLPPVRVAMNAGKVEVDAVATGDNGPPEKGQLTFFENSVDTTTGTIALRATFANNEERLWPGEFVTVNVLLRIEADALVVPQSAIQVGQNDSYVFVIKPDNTAEYRVVKVGRTIDGMSVVEKGLQDGDRVVTDGQLRLSNGSHVAIRGAQDSKPGNAS